MGLFKTKKRTEEIKKKFTVYIAEDNPVYLKQLEFYLKKVHGEAISIESFPVSEVIDVKLEHGHTPSVIIMDHNLSAKYDDAISGIEALKAIHNSHPEILLILHSAHKSAEEEVSNMDHSFFTVVPKGEQAFEKISNLISKRLA